MLRRQPGEGFPVARAVGGGHLVEAVEVEAAVARAATRRQRARPRLVRALRALVVGAELPPLLRKGSGSPLAGGPAVGGEEGGAPCKSPLCRLTLAATRHRRRPLQFPPHLGGDGRALVGAAREGIAAQQGRAGGVCEAVGAAVVAAMARIERRRAVERRGGPSAGALQPDAGLSSPFSTVVSTMTAPPPAEVRTRITLASTSCPGPSAAATSPWLTSMRSTSPAGMRRSTDSIDSLLVKGRCPSISTLPALPDSPRHARPAVEREAGNRRTMSSAVTGWASAKKAKG